MTDLHIKSIGYLLKEGISHVIKKIFLKNFVYNYENYTILKIQPDCYSDPWLLYVFTYTTCSHLQVIDKPVVVKLCLLHINGFGMNSN